MPIELPTVVFRINKTGKIRSIEVNGQRLEGLEQVDITCVPSGRKVKFELHVGKIQFIEEEDKKT